MSIKKRVNKYWIDFYYNRKRYRLPSPDNSKAGARVYEAKCIQKLSMGESIESEPEPERAENGSITFAKFSEKWMEVYAKGNNKNSEYMNKRYMLNNHLLPFFGKMHLDQIKNQSIEMFKTEKSKTKLKNKSINNCLIALNKCLHTALDWEVLKNIPKVQLLKVGPQSFDFLSKEDLETLLANTNGEIHDMILITSKTGMRHGELTALSWSDISLEKGNEKITIQKSAYRGIISSPKSNKIRYIPLTNEVIEMLLKKGKRTGLLFPSSNNTPLAAYLTLKRLHEACDISGIRRIGWHVLRHTTASHLVQNGTPIYTVKELLGHSDVSTTQRYAHLGELETRNAINTLNNFGHNLVTIDFSPQNKYQIMEQSKISKSHKHQ